VQSDGYWHPDKTYAWNGTGTPPANPSTGSDIETSLLTYDAFGNVTQTRNANKFLNATIWAHNNSLPIATATNGGAGKLFFDNFERDGLQDPNVKPRRSGNAVLFTNMTANPKTYSVRVDGESLTPASGSLTMNNSA